MSSMRNLLDSRFGSVALAGVPIVTIAALAWIMVSRYGRYTVEEAAARDSIRVSPGVLDVGVASDGSLVGIVATPDSGLPETLAVVSWISAGRTRELFQFQTNGADNRRNRIAESFSKGKAA